MHISSTGDFKNILAPKTATQLHTMEIVFTCKRRATRERHRDLPWLELLTTLKPTPKIDRASLDLGRVPGAWHPGKQRGVKWGRGGRSAQH